MSAMRWAKPLRVLDAQESSEGDLIHFPDGRTFMDIDLVTDEEGLERLRLGWVCRACLEPQEVAMPEHCSLCGYQMRADQPVWFARTYKPEVVHIGSRINKADEIARLREMDEYESRTGIIIPDHIKFPNGTV